jgi:uncharacterized protein (TIGR04255 family)
MTDKIRKLAKHPLNCVLAEFKYSPILKIGSHIPDIQERIRKKYPVLGQVEQQHIQIAGQEIQVSKSSEWVFSSEDQHSSVVIGSDRFIFITSDYERFPNFSERCEDVLSILADIADPSLLLKIGLRYNDYIHIEDHEDATNVVGTQFLPLPDLIKLGGNIGNYRTETSIFTSEGTLLIRSLVGKHGLAVMPDLSQVLPPLGLNFKGDLEKTVLLLDFDHSWTAENSGIKFSIDAAKSQLERLHNIARQAFWEATTEYARSELWS